MNDIVPLLASISHEFNPPARSIELAVVTQVFTDAGSGDTNLAVNARLRGSELELQHIPVAVGRIGLSCVPREGDLVVVAFVGGDLDGAIVLASLYDEQNRPPQAEPSEVVYVVPAGDDSGVRRVEIEMANGNTVTLSDDEATVAFGGTTLTVASGGDVTIASKGDVNISADGAINVEAGGDLNLSAGINLSAEAAANATLKANANATVEGAAAAKLKGAMTTIAGTTMFSAG